ncbi:MAG: Choline-sulfatase [candidate division BRC1 bacterium ADurb.BinA364]|nr:MAG: Choline-sulfatase [candidate division BRC1 bacterium ADurb.BinA364]
MLTNVGQDQTPPEMLSSETTFAQILSQAGYRTGYAGKWHVGVRKGPRDWGFTDVEPESRRQYISRFSESIELDDKQAGGPVHGNRFLLSARRSGAVAQDDTGYCETQGLALLDAFAKQGSPFFLRIDFSAPHPTYVIPEPFASAIDPGEIRLDPSVTEETFARKPYIHEEQTRRWGTRSLPEETWRRVIARYHGMVSMMDGAVGRILERLRALGLEDNTLVIFTTDHGDATGSHCMYDKGYCAYEEQYRIPLIVRGPGVPRGGECREWISSLDLAPTIVEAAGLKMPAELEIDGKSLLPALREGAPLGRDSIFGEFHGMQYGLCSIRWARDERFKYVLNGNDRPELYDTIADPFELRNLAGTGEAADEEKRMYSVLMRWMQATRDPMLKTIWGRAAYDPSFDPGDEAYWFV